MFVLRTNGHTRHHVRLSCWRESDAWHDAALAVPEPANLPDTPLQDALALVEYPEDAPPVFIGHYKMDGMPRLKSAQILCLDDPKALCVCYWMGEVRLNPAHLCMLPQPIAEAMQVWPGYPPTG